MGRRAYRLVGGDDAAFDGGSVPRHHGHMNVRKLDAGLASIVIRTPHQAGEVQVFVHTTEPPTLEQAQVLTAAGVQNVGPDKRLFAAVLSLDAVKYLSQLPWVQAISSAKRLVASMRSSNGQI